jgi:hypothetical protein
MKNKNEWAPKSLGDINKIDKSFDRVFQVMRNNNYLKKGSH